MALPNDDQTRMEGIRAAYRPASRPDFIGWGPIPLMKEEVEPIMAIFAHFMHDDTVSHFALKEDVDTHMPIVEVETGLTGDEFMTYYTSAIEWWLTQPQEWHDHVHLAVW